jgi:DMSO/TMAO reductase YedYZ molybdopterin-dependent catalytic subunit
MRHDNTKLLKLLRYISLLIVFFLGLITIFATGGGHGSITSDSTPQDLGYVEIREYEGQDLSSINDFRENSILGPQYVNHETYQLSITGLVEKPTDYSYGDLLNNFAHYTKVTTLHCVEGWSVKLLWEGVLVKDVIAEARPLLDDTKVIIFHAYDGYTTSFPIEYITQRDIIMAYEMNDVTLPPERGFPFQLVAEDKWGYKWIKWITKIELSDNKDYLGYWESYGYSNDGSLTDCSPGPVSAQPTWHPERNDCCTCHSTAE